MYKLHRLTINGHIVRKAFDLYAAEHANRRMCLVCGHDQRPTGEGSKTGVCDQCRGDVVCAEMILQRVGLVRR